MKIQKLKLFVHEDCFLEQLHFYETILGFPIVGKKEASFTIKTTETLLTFEKSTQYCYYHFAFNIPSFSTTQALEWLKQRVAILPDENGSEIVDFPNWNATAIYFYDPAGNIAEVVARRALAVELNTPFDQSSLFSISEIGLPVADVEAMYQLLQQQFQPIHLPRYSGDFQRFGASGDEEGLFIIVNKAQKLWFPTQKPSSPFPLEAVVNLEGNVFELKF